MAVLKNTTLTSDTTAIQLPVGSSAQRPVSATNGYLRFNNGLKVVEHFHSETSTWRYLPDITRQGLIVHYDFGETNCYNGSGTTITDLSGVGNNGTLTNSPTYSTTDGGIITFNGSNHHIYKGSVTNPPTTNFSMNVVAKFSDTGAGGRYVMALGRDIGTNGGMALIAYGYAAANSGQIIFELGSGFGRVGSGIVPTTGIWYDLTVTADGNTTKFYVNGVLANTGTQSTGQIAPSPGLSIGSYLSAAIPPAASSAWFNGNIASVKIYNRELSHTDVTKNFRAHRTRFGL
jgi:hypothetical protein